jgi:hypothetical protein
MSDRTGDTFRHQQHKEYDNMSKTLKPGQPAPKSGIYDMLGPRGGHTGEQVVSTQHKPLPPTPKPGQSYELTKPAHHQPSHKK